MMTSEGKDIAATIARIKARLAATGPRVPLSLVTSMGVKVSPFGDTLSPLGDTPRLARVLPFVRPLAAGGA